MEIFKWLFFIFCVFCILLAVFGNGLVIMSWLVEPKLRTPSNALLFSLACADVIVGTVSIPLLTLYEMHGTWIFGESVCQFWLIVLWTAGFVSSNHLVLIAVDRYRIIREGLQYLQRQTLKSVLLPVIFIWFASLSVTLPMIIDWEKTGDFHYKNATDEWACRSKASVSRVVYTNFTVVLLPGITMLIIYRLIYVELRNMFRKKAGIGGGEASAASNASRTSGSMEETSLENGNGPHSAEVAYSNKKQKSGSLSEDYDSNQSRETVIMEVKERKRLQYAEKERRAAKTLGFLIAAFIICWSPYLLVSFLRILGAAAKHALGRRIPLVSALLGWFNSCVNPVIYALRNPDFKDAFRKCLSILTCRLFFR